MIRRFFCWIGHHRPRCLVLANFDGEYFATQYIRCDSCGIWLSGYERTRFDRTLCDKVLTTAQHTQECGCRECLGDYKEPRP